MTRHVLGLAMAVHAPLCVHQRSSVPTLMLPAATVLGVVQWAWLSALRNCQAGTQC